MSIDDVLTLLLLVIAAVELGITMRCATTLATHRTTSAIHTRDDTPVG